MLCGQENSRHSLNQSEVKSCLAGTRFLALDTGLIYRFLRLLIGSLPLITSVVIGQSAYFAVINYALVG